MLKTLLKNAVNDNGSQINHDLLYKKIIYGLNYFLKHALVLNFGFLFFFLTPVLKFISYVLKK